MAGKSGAIRAGRAFVEIFADSTLLQKGLKKVEGQLRAFGSNVRSLGLQLAAALVLPGFALLKIIQNFAEFEQTMARVKALTAATGKEFRELEETAKRLGRTTVFTATQAGKAMAFFALAGQNTREILDSIGPTLDLAAAGQIDVAQAADIVVKAMKGMGIAASETGRVVDVLSAGMTTANTTLEQMGEALNFIGPIARAAGFELEEVVASIQILSNAGLQASLAGTALRGILLRLVNPPREASIELKKLGIEIRDVDGEIRPFVDIIGQLEKSLKDLPTGPRLQSIGSIFPLRQAAGATVLINEGAASLDLFTKKLKAAAGVAKLIASVQLNTLTGGFTLLKSAIEGVAIAIGTQIVSPLRLLLELATGVARNILKWVNANQLLVVGALAAFAALGSLAVALVAVGTAFQVAAFIVRGLSLVLASVGVVIAFILSPLGIMTAALIAAAGVWLSLGNNIQRVVSSVHNAAKFIGETFGELGENVKETLNGITNALQAGNIELANKILWLGIQVIWERGKENLITLWNSITDFVFLSGADLLLGLSTIWAGIGDSWSDMILRMQTEWVAMTEFLKFVQIDFETFLTKSFNLIAFLFDDSLDLSELNRGADKQGEERKTQQEDDLLDGTTRKNQENANDAAKQRRSDVLQEVKDIVDQFRGDREKDSASRDDPQTKAISKSALKLREVQLELIKAIDKASRERRKADAKLKRSAVTAGVDTSGTSEAIRETRGSAKGLFNVRAILSLQGGSTTTEESIAKSTAATVVAVKKLIKVTKDSGPEFG